MKECLDLLSITNKKFRISQEKINKLDIETYTEITKVRLDLISLEIRLKHALKL